MESSFPNRSLIPPSLFYLFPGKVDAQRHLTTIQLKPLLKRQSDEAVHLRLGGEHDVQGFLSPE